MDGASEYKHSCRYCKKKFMCGRSLGGHMRSHMTIPGNEADVILQKTSGPDGESDEICGVEAHHQGGYGLRENPKKSSRFSHSAILAGKDAANVCKKCGKGFSSCKALFGHMKCHSERCSQDEGSCIEVQNAFDGLSESEDDVPKRKSKRRVRHTAPSSIPAFRGMNSSYGCQFDQEQVDAAITVMMLSRGISHFSDFEKECAAEVNFPNSPDRNSVSKNFGLHLNKEVGVQNKMAIDSGNDGDLRKSFKNRERFVGTESETSAGNERGGIAFLESRKARCDVNGRKVCVSANVSNRESDYECEEDYEVLDSELVGNSSNLSRSDNKREIPSEIGKTTHKRARIESHTLKKQKCKEIEYGSHRSSHKGVNSCYVGIDENENNSLETNLSWDQVNRTMAKDEAKYSAVENEMPQAEANAEMKKGKRHGCPVCFKIFRSGQALGGHKRSHMLSTGSPFVVGNDTDTVLIQRQMAGSRDFLDLNIPASDDHDLNDHSGSSSS